ncbi:flavin-containing monooxygenase [Aurantivibrio plasticivorans]
MMNSSTKKQQQIINSAAVIIIGGGLGGLCAAKRFLDEGIDFIILEKSNDIGGTWRDNTYPGCACDTQSHLYSYSFAGNPNWSRRFAGWSEIKQYIDDFVEANALERYTRLNTAMTSATFDNDKSLWSVTTSSGITYEGQYFLLATGPLHVPVIPNLKGANDFEGHQFHTARWDHDYSLENKRIAIIGTGASGVQVIPEVAKKAKKLSVFQRSGAWVLPRNERPYSALTKWIFRNVPFARKLYRSFLYVANEARIFLVFQKTGGRISELLIRKYIKYQVKNKDTRKKLIPTYNLGCKRVLISSQYYKTFNRENVDINLDDIASIEKNGVVTSQGGFVPVDCIIYATGFDTDPRSYLSQVPIRGSQGELLLDAWKGGPESYYGITTPGFANFFQLIGANTGLGHNSIIFIIECQVNLITKLIKQAKQRSVSQVEVTSEAAKDFLDTVVNLFDGTVWDTGCRSWYHSKEGLNFSIWPASTTRFWLKTLKVREQDFEWRKRANTGSTSAGATRVQSVSRNAALENS